MEHTLTSARIIIGDSRAMPEIQPEQVDLVVTSPPYWHLKDYGTAGQIGFGQTLHEYLKSLHCVWSECYRVIRPGGRLCINIGDQFARAVIYGRYKVIPLHAETVAQCEQIGFDFMGSIIWQKKTTVESSGGAAVMGSYPYPPNGIVEIDYEHILILKKPGNPKKVATEIKRMSELTKEEWKMYFTGHWLFGGVRQAEHEAMFPEELPRRLIRMFSFAHDTVLDPFLGSGTTVQVALELRRSAIGYEVNEQFRPIIENRLGLDQQLLIADYEAHIETRSQETTFQISDYEPRIADAKPNQDPSEYRKSREQLYKVVAISNQCSLILEDSRELRFLGLRITAPDQALSYLNEYVQNKKISYKSEQETSADDTPIDAYVYLKNKIFINAYLIKAGYARVDSKANHRLKGKFIRVQEKADEAPDRLL